MGRTLLRSLVESGLRRSSSWETVTFGGLQYQLGLSATRPSLGFKEEPIRDTFTDYAQYAYLNNAVVFALMERRRQVFSQARFRFQQMRGGIPGRFYGTPALDVLDGPGRVDSSSDLMSQAIQHADLAGNAFLLRRATDIVCLRPDWVTIVAGSRGYPDQGGVAVDAEVLGILYFPGGRNEGEDPVPLLPGEYAHFKPTPDPRARFRGISWLKPVVKEVMADSASTTHKLMFFENGATPSTVVSLDPNVTPERFKAWVDLFEQQKTGVLNAYKTIYLGGGADVEVVGANLRQLDFKVTQGAGEPLALTTPVPTPGGWTTMADIQPGDEVFGREGRPVLVTDVGQVHTGRACYRVTFSDRTSIVADGSHLWTAMDRNTNDRAELTYTTDELGALIDEWRARGVTQANRIGIPAGAPVQLGARDLLVDPYVLGVWLGDGTTAGAAITGSQPDLDIIAEEIERRGYTVTHWTVRDKAPVIGLPGGVLAALDALGVLGGKFIPDEYLRASHAQRLDLLRGLMDTDGTVGHVGKETCEFSSKLEHLGRQVAELARSLGYRVTVSRKVEKRSLTGETWRVTFRADPDVIPFLLPRKAGRVQTPVHVKNRAIVSIEPVESVPVRCITVDSPDHLFRAGDGWTLTHNTRLAAAAGVPPIIAGFSEGLASATYSNYGQARRAYSDVTLWDLWGKMANALESIIPPPSGSRVWVDASGIPFLQEDEQDAADIIVAKANAMRTLWDGGAEPESVVKAVNAGDLSLLKHSGNLSVQLQPDGVAPSEPQPTEQQQVIENARRALVASGIARPTQAQIAEHLGVSDRTVRRWEEAA